MTARHRWSSTPGCPRQITPRVPFTARRTSPATARPGLRLTAWRAVWPMLRFNPVLAAKYAAMTKAADGAAEAAATQADTGSRQATRGGGRGPRAARQGPGRVRRLAAALDLLPGRPRHQLGPRRGPGSLHLPGGGCLTSASIADRPCHGRLRPSSPQRGRTSPHGRRGPTPLTTLGSSPPVARSFSPARLNAVGAGLPASRGHAEPACTTWSEKTRVTGARNRAAGHPSSRRGPSPCPQSGSRQPPARGSRGTPAPTVARTPDQDTSHNNSRKLPRAA